MLITHRTALYTVMSLVTTLGLSACNGANNSPSSDIQQNNASSSHSSSQSSSPGLSMSSNSTASSQGNYAAMVLSTAGGDKPVKFSQPEGTNLTGQLAMPAARTKTASQQTLELTSPRYPLYDYWQFTKLLPLPDLFCEAPANANFSQLAEELGGFRKTTRVSIAQDATTPTFYTGLYDFRRSFLAEAATANASGAGVTIQRPNIVGQLGNKAFYLSEVYGLLTLTYTPAPVQTPKVSCGLPIPGTPNNFVYANNQLYVMTEDLQKHIVGVLQFDISGDHPVYVDGQVFHNQDLLDARLFNDTLALYLKSYLPSDELPSSANGSDSATTMNASRIAAPIGSDLFIPYAPRTLLGHELKILATVPTLSVTHSVFFKEDQEENRQNLTKEEVEAPREWSSFNPYLSASGEYLVISEAVNERFFNGYNRRSYNRCTDYEVTNFPYEYCQTHWKRIENPDYIPLPSSGTLTCEGDLYTCLKQRAPSVARYINVADGQTCTQYVRSQYQCLASETVTYDYPEYRYQNTSQLHIFRFNNGQFTQLDNTLATIKNSQLVASEAPLRIDGRIEKHDHIRFIGDVLYTITDDNFSQSLQTLSIQGNSAVYINKLSLNNQRYAQLNAVFSSDTLYISQSSWNNPSNLQTVSLANPIAPKLSENIKIPTQFQQLLLAPEHLIGLGVTDIVHPDNRREHFGTATSFTLSGQEKSNFLLGGDYNYYSTSIQSDDQVVTLDNMQNRLIVPYSLSAPLAGIQAPYSQNRVTMINTQDGKLTEENTVNLPQLPNRTLSVDAESVLTFSENYIHWLTKNNGWHTRNIFNGELPSEVYYTHEHGNQVQKHVRPESYLFTLVKNTEGTAGETLDSLTISRAQSQICTQESVYFDNDRILIVQEVPGKYISYEDCPTETETAEKILTGYRINENSFSTITDQQELNALFTQINWGVVCVLDPSEPFGDRVNTPENLTEAQVENLSCFTQDQFYSLGQTL